MEPVVRQKALIYCIEAGRLLVCRHLDFPWNEVGVQVPGGTIRPGEAPEDAALRELIEETGESTFALAGYVGLTHYDITPYRLELQERHFFLARPTAPLPERWMGREEHDGQAPPTRLEWSWIPLSAGHVLQAGQGALLGRASSMISKHPKS